MDQYADWRCALEEGRGVETEPGNPKSGFYRYRGEAFAIWRDDQGKLFCWRSDQKRRTPTEPDEIDTLFSYCARNPVPHEMFELFANTGAWPETVEEPETPVAAESHTRLALKISALKESAEAWLRETGRINSKRDADKAANFAAMASDFETQAELARVEAKAPHLDASRQVDALWQPIVKGAADLKRTMKKAAEAYLIAERDRLAREAAAKAAQGQTVHAYETSAIAGTQGKVISIRTRQVNEIVDWAALFTHMATLNVRTAELEAACQTFVNKLVAAGHAVPGVKSKRVEEVA